MTDFLTRMARAALGLTPVAKALVASRYAPAPEPAEQVVETEAPPTREEPSVHTPTRLAQRLETASTAAPPPQRLETASTATPPPRPAATIARAAVVVGPPPMPASVPTATRAIEQREPARSREPIAVDAPRRSERTERTEEPATRPPTRRVDRTPTALDAVEVRDSTEPSRGPRPIAPPESMRRRGAEPARSGEPAAVTTRAVAGEPAPISAAPPPPPPISPLIEVSSRERPSSSEQPSARERSSARPPAPPVRGRLDERVPETPAEPPSIRVTIGRVEVRAVTPPPPAEPPPPAKPRISLDDYLRSHRGRSR